MKRLTRCPTMQRTARASPGKNGGPSVRTWTGPSGKGSSTQGCRTASSPNSSSNTTRHLRGYRWKSCVPISETRKLTGCVHEAATMKLMVPGIPLYSRLSPHSLPVVGLPPAVSGKRRVGTLQSSEGCFGAEGQMQKSRCRQGCTES